MSPGSSTAVSVYSCNGLMLETFILPPVKNNVHKSLHKTLISTRELATASDIISSTDRHKIARNCGKYVDKNSSINYANTKDIAAPKEYGAAKSVKYTAHYGAKSPLVRLISISENDKLLPNKTVISIEMDSILACLTCACLRRENLNFRRGFFKYLRTLYSDEIDGRTFNWRPIQQAVILYLKWSEELIMDSAWSGRITIFAKRHQVLEDSLYWLSSLGGGFSALGEDCRAFAEEAGAISWKQYRLAKMLGDVIMQSRARLYFALSLMQIGRLKLARAILWNEYRYIQEAGFRDERLKTICQALWNKLRYTRQLRSGKFIEPLS